MSLQVEIVKAKPADLKRINELNRALHENLQKFREKKLSKKELDKKKFFRKDVKRIFVAKTSNKIIGFVAFQSKTQENEWCGKCIELEQIYIKPSHANKGIGKKLLQKVREESEKRKANIRLMMSPKNKNALQFYTKQGFETVGLEMVLKCR